MSNKFGSSAHKGATVHIEGLREVISKLNKAGADFTDLRELNHEVGNIVISNARVPRKSGSVAGSLRAGRGKGKAVVRAGYAKKARYAGVLHYGNPHRKTKGQPFLTDALKRSQGQVIKTYITGIDRILITNGLK